MELEKPTTALVRKYIKEFENNDNYQTSDDVIIKLIKAFPKNTDFVDIRLKVTTINALYSTNIFNTNQLAEHISKINNLDEKLDRGDSNVVDEIARGHKIERAKGGKELYLYSFATKYCSWHNQKEYPIYDSYVEKVLSAYKRQFKFSNFRLEDLRDFEKFKKVLQDFETYFNLQEFDTKQIDKFLWLYGKEKF